MTGGEPHRGGHRNSFDRLAFLAVVLGVHMLLGLACVAIGANPRCLVQKRRRATFNVWNDLFLVSAGALRVRTFLSLMRWAENYHCSFSERMSFACAWIGRAALRRRWRYWVRLHIAGMGLSYILTGGGLLHPTMESSFRL